MRRRMGVKDDRMTNPAGGRGGSLGQLILMFILGWVSAIYFPDSRQMLINVTMPVINPYLVWSADAEIHELARSVQREGRERHVVPATREWPGWLMLNFTTDASTDPWGRAYTYRAWPDSFMIRSYGPDGEALSVDDLRVVTRRPY